jgi:hypothetical protein
MNFIRSISAIVCTSDNGVFIYQLEKGRWRQQAWLDGKQLSWASYKVDIEGSQA